MALAPGKVEDVEEAVTALLASCFLASMASGRDGRGVNSLIHSGTSHTLTHPTSPHHSDPTVAHRALHFWDLLSQRTYRVTQIGNA